MPGLVPGIPIRKARHCHMNRDGRDKPGHDELGFNARYEVVIIPYTAYPPRGTSFPRRG
jgi:hypothetical protein